MKNTFFSFEDMRSAAYSLRRKSEEWIKEAESVPEEFSECREELVRCGRIIAEYAGFADAVCDEYEQNENGLIHQIGERI